MEQKFPLIKIKEISKEYLLGDTLVKAVDNISLEIKQGEFLSILGKSGSGKSTLMHMIGLLDRPTHGEIYLEGRLASKLEDKELAKIRAKTIGFIFQSFNLLARTSALDNVMLPTIYLNHASDGYERAKELLTRVGLQDRMKNMPNQLSGGQQQRVAIARALMNKPPVILADEPTGNLDTKSSDEIIKLLTDLHNEGTTVIVVTHDEGIARLTDRVVRLSDGKIIEDLDLEAGQTGGLAK